MSYYASSQPDYPRIAMPDNARIVRQFTEETLNKGNIDTAGEFVWEDVVEQIPFAAMEIATSF